MPIKSKQKARGPVSINGVVFLPGGQLGAYAACEQVRPLDTKYRPFISA